MNNRTKRIFTSTMILIFILSNLNSNLNAVETGKLLDRFNLDGSIIENVISVQVPHYSEVLKNYISTGTGIYTGEEIGINLKNFTDSKGELPIASGDGLMLTTSNQFVEWSIDVKESALYEIRIIYRSEVSERQLPAVRKIQVNGKIPFSEAETISFPRFFKDANKPNKNSLGDEVRPIQTEIFRTSDIHIYDSKNEYQEPLLFYFTAGLNKIALYAVEESLIIDSISLVSATMIPDYNEYSLSYKGTVAKSGIDRIRLQAEDVSSIAYKNDSNLFLETDSDPFTDPYGDYYQLINTFGGYSWRNGGQKASWNFNVTESGMYKIALHVKQDFGDGMSSSRQISIDNKVLFKELLVYDFQYSRKWYTETLHEQDGNDFLFYLEKGNHSIDMSVVLSKRTEVSHLLSDAIESLSKISREIVLITGTYPDPNYDYELDKTIPDLTVRMNDIRKKLLLCKDIILKDSNKTPILVNNFDKIEKQLGAMVKDPDIIPNRLTDLTEALTGIGNWLSALESAPLQIDYFGIYPPNEKIENRQSGFFMIFATTIKNFIYSFSKDYNAIGSETSVTSNTKETALEVWISRGKEWGSILKQLIDTDFQYKKDIKVNVNILPSGSIGTAANPLLLSINAGNAPDVVLGLPSTMPAEYAMRNALYDLSKFSDYSNISKQFLPASIIPYEYNNGVYALPETINFRLLFYRKDIFDEFNFTVPKTWNDFYYKLLPSLNKNSMQFFMPAALDMFLFQRGKGFYNDNGKASALGTPQAYEAFKQMCEMYTNLGIPVSANFFNRFRTGDMPVGIADSTMYMTLVTAAPELKGKWAIANIPGFEDNGEINNSSGGVSLTGSVIIAKTKTPDASWDFLKWWMSENVQTSFARTLEGRIGVSSRWMSGNLESFKKLSWKTGDIDIINDMLLKANEIPIVPGGYFTNRHLSNAFLRVISQNENTRDALEEAEKAINIEITRRRAQLQLD